MGQPISGLLCIVGIEYMKKAFTLVELLVVIAVIAVLMGILMPALGSAREQARRTVCSAHMHDLGLSISLYCEQEDGALPALRVGQNGDTNNTQLTNHHARWWRINNQAGQMSYWNLGLLWKAGIVEDGKIFFCPGARAAFKYKDYTEEGFPTDIQISATSARGVRVPYSYNPECVSLTDRTRKYEKLMAMKVDALLVVDHLTSTNATTGAGIAHGKGWNLLRGDNSVAFSVNSAAQEVIDASSSFDGKDYESLDSVLQLLK